MYKNRKETAIYKRRNNTQTTQKHRIHKIEKKLTKHGNIHDKNIKKKNKSSNYKITKRNIIMR
jgi:hypothetical protein